VNDLRSGRAPAQGRGHRARVRPYDARAHARSLDHLERNHVHEVIAAGHRALAGEHRAQVAHRDAPQPFRAGVPVGVPVVYRVNVSRVDELDGAQALGEEGSGPVGALARIEAAGDDDAPRRGGVLGLAQRLGRARVRPGPEVVYEKARVEP